MLRGWCGQPVKQVLVLHGLQSPFKLSVTWMANTSVATAQTTMYACAQAHKRVHTREHEGGRHA
jgi:hypothetical protein